MSHTNRQQPYKMGSSSMLIIHSSISCNHLVTVMVCGEAINDVLPLSDSVFEQSRDLGSDGPNLS